MKSHREREIFTTSVSVSGYKYRTDTQTNGREHGCQDIPTTQIRTEHRVSVRGFWEWSEILDRFRLREFLFASIKLKSVNSLFFLSDSSSPSNRSEYRRRR